ncbi:3-hydroxyacyl-ACP dehydratase FabZ family protein [Streptomyces sp. NPDC001401]|uniref:3-hydroxyacyl-ACP dehydratase FabZ family protein n=1 Tax=Streptomyces sp. NPDC001401 TaxID=3364570 RepID=UPI0036C42990
MPAPSKTAKVFDALHSPPLTEQSLEGTRVTVRVPVKRAGAQMAGHYPGFPIMPGVLLIDCVRQAASSALGRELRLCRIDRARFTRPLLAGDELELSLLVMPQTPQTGTRIAVRARAARGDGLTAADLSVVCEPVVSDA